MKTPEQYLDENNINTNHSELRWFMSRIIKQAQDESYHQAVQDCARVAKGHKIGLMDGCATKDSIADAILNLCD